MSNEEKWREDFNKWLSMYLNTEHAEEEVSENK
jgi:hypothetical protein